MSAAPLVARLKGRTCRYIDLDAQLCTAQAADDDGEILLCERHLAWAFEMLSARLLGYVKGNV